MKVHPQPLAGAFTVLNALFLSVTLLLVAFILAPAFSAAKCQCQKVNCVNNLKQIGIAFRIWQGDHEDKYPMDVAANQGGAREKIAAGDVAGSFLVMSNELATPTILVCPEDRRHEAATNFGAAFTRANVSYFLTLTLGSGSPQTLVSGDANLVQNNRPVPAGILSLWNTTTWTRARHHYSGNILIPDGSVEVVKQIGWPASAQTYYATNCVVVP